MRFKKGDKIRVKTSVTLPMLAQLSISKFHFAQTGTFIRYTGKTKWSGRVGADCSDIVIRVKKMTELSEFYLPENWIELDKKLRQGHHLTSIFKDEFVCSK